MGNYNLINEKGSYVMDSMIMKKGLVSDAGSKMLENYPASFTSTIVDRLDKNDYELYAIGQISEFGLREEPNGALDAVLKDEVDLGIGIDTGGSLLRPGLMRECRVFVPSTGLISSFGTIKPSSSLSRPGIFGEYEIMTDCLNVVSGRDEKDPKTIEEKISFSFEDVNVPYQRIAIVGYPDSSFVELLSHPTEFHILYEGYINEVFEIIGAVELASQTAKFDGIRYGHRTEDYDDLDDYYTRTRSEGFDHFTKKEILKGYIYSGNEYGREIYENALKLRSLFVDAVEKTFRDFHFIVGSSDSYLPALASLTNRPIFAFKHGYIMADYLEDQKLINFARNIEEAL